MNDELKPCPFCGGEAAPCRDIHGEHFVKCRRCKTRFGGGAWWATDDAAAEAWNRRVNDD